MHILMTLGQPIQYIPATDSTSSRSRSPNDSVMFTVAGAAHRLQYSPPRGESRHRVLAPGILGRMRARISSLSRTKLELLRLVGSVSPSGPLAVCLSWSLPIFLRPCLVSTILAGGKVVL
jgi:hypothetical protein